MKALKGLRACGAAVGLAVLLQTTTSLALAPLAYADEATTTGDLNVRTGPAMRYDKVAVAPKGSKLELTGETSGSFTQVVWNGAERWVATSYVTSSLPAVKGKGKATAPLMIRTTSTESFTSLGVIPRDTVIDLTGTVENGMAQVIWNGSTRWVNNRYVTSTNASAGASASSSGSSASRKDINKGWSSGLEKINSDAQAIAWEVWDRYPDIKTMYGWRNDATADHPAGRAVDVMIPDYRSDNSLGYEIAEYFKANAKEFGVSYIIWNQKIWSVQRNKEGWRSMADRGGDSANHKDHVHINTY